MFDGSYLDELTGDKIKIITLGKAAPDTLKFGIYNTGSWVAVVDGKVMPGAAQAYAESVYVTNALGKVTVTGGNGTTGWNSVADGQTVTVTASDAATRPFLGFRVDGVLQDRSQKAIVLDATYDGKTVEAVYGTDWYVDANNGNDDWDGQTPATARKTLEKIMEMKFVAGDTVHAAPGVYDRGTMTNGVNFYNKGDGVCDLPSRVVVPWSVRLVADEGPEKTFIVGSAATDSARTLGLGPGAVRCATVCSSATLSGFTLTGGHTLDVGDVPPADKDRDDDFNGAGVLGVGGTASLVENCIISNNVAFRGGAVVYATVNRCRIFDCQAASEAAATWVCHINGSYIDHFRTDKPVVQYYRGFNSTTIGPDICDGSGNPKTAVYSSNDGNNPSATPAYNSVFLCKPGATVREVAFNSVFLQDSTYVGTYHTNCQMVATATGFFDEEGAPIPGSGCPALGFADVARYDFDALGWTDVVGNPRFSNNAMDAGAFQSRWEAEYARKLSGRRMVGLSAPSNAVEVAAGVRLVSGELVLQTKANVTSNCTDYSLTAEGDGMGVLLGDGIAHTFATPFRGPGDVTKTGAGMMTLAAVADGGGVFRQTGATIVAEGVLDLGGTAQTFAALGGAGTVRNGTVKGALLATVGATGDAVPTFENVTFANVKVAVAGDGAEVGTRIPLAKASAVPAGLLGKTTDKAHTVAYSVEDGVLYATLGPKSGMMVIVR